jgi:hypothetical protein
MSSPFLSDTKLHFPLYSYSTFLGNNGLPIQAYRTEKSLNVLKILQTLFHEARKGFGLGLVLLTETADVS